MVTSTRPTTEQILHNGVVLKDFLDSLNYHVQQVFFPEDFGAVGDGTTDDTEAIRQWLAASEGNIGRVKSGATYLIEHIYSEDISDLTIFAFGATFKNAPNQTVALFYADGAMICFGGNCQNHHIYGLRLNGNREASPLFKGMNHGLQYCTGAGDFRSNNGGDVKSLRNINIYYFDGFDFGGYHDGFDKFGDGIYCFGVDGLIIKHSRFTDVGRWGVALSDCVNFEIAWNDYDSSKAGTYALGFCDVENESIDQINGSWSENGHIHHNRLKGYCQILVGAGCNPYNNNGAKHYLKNILVEDNTMVISGGAHANPDYTINLIFLGCAPFCHVKPTNHVVTNESICFRNNTAYNYFAGNLSIGAGINAQGLGSGVISSTYWANIVDNITFYDNKLVGFSKAVQCAGTSTSEGYTFTNVKACRNVGDCKGLANSIGIRFAATQLVNCLVDENNVSGYTIRGVSLEDGRDIGAVDSFTIASRNILAGSETSVAVFAYIYKSSYIENVVKSGGASSIISTLIDKDYGNTWNRLTRNLTSFTVGNASQVAKGGIDVNSHTKLGYTVAITPLTAIGQLLMTGYVTDPGVAMFLFANFTGSPVGVATQDFIVIVERR